MHVFMATARHGESVALSASVQMPVSTNESVASRNDRARNLKYFSVVAVITQSTAVVLLARYVRTRQGDMFFSSTAVILAELCKLLACLLLVYLETGSPRAFYAHLKRFIFSQPLDNLKISVPALVYVVQNNLLYLALSNLDAATYQVSYQLKILTTALFSVVLLRKRLSATQWLSLLVLFAGVSIVQLQPTESTQSSSAATEQRPLLGFIAIVLASMSSGFAGVYFEKLLKNTEQSLWVRNIQLGFLGVVFGSMTAFVQDGKQINERGFLFGYDWLIWILVALQSFGGLMIAMVIKYADNIVKGFANSFSIVLACACSVVLFDFPVTYQFAAGASLVVVAVYMYGRYPPVSAAPSATAVSAQPTGAHLHTVANGNGTASS